MATRTFSQLSNVGNPLSTDQFVGVRSGTTDALLNASDTAILSNANTYTGQQNYTSLQLTPYKVNNADFVSNDFNIGLLNPIPTYFLFQLTSAITIPTITLPLVSNYVGPMYFNADINSHAFRPHFVSSDGSAIINPFESSSLVSSYSPNIFEAGVAGQENFLIFLSTGNYWQCILSADISVT